MKNFFKKKYKTILKLLLFIVGLTSFVVASYTYYVIRQAQLKLKELQLVANQQISVSSNLEEGSYVLKENLKRFLLPSNETENFQTWLDGKIASGKAEIFNSEILIKKDIELPFIKENSCIRYRCLQYKVSFEELPSSLWKGLLGIEDFRFLDHEGVDFISIMRAVVADIKAMKLVQGGSTLTQQLVKNLFLSNEKKFERKIREVIYAIFLEKKLSKEEIITAYFNEVFWGTHQGIYLKGIGAASIAYFGKKPSELTNFEATILISMLKGPYFYHPLKHHERLKERVRVVFNRLDKINLIDSDQKYWTDNQWRHWFKELKKSSDQDYLYAHYLLKDDGHNFWNPFEKFVYYQMTTKVKRDLSQRLGNTDIGIKTIAISAKCKSLECDKKFSFYSKIERDKDVAIREEKHQVGSILKPIIYEQLIELGKNLNDLVSTKKITLKLISGEWSPKDASMAKSETISLKNALLKSRNIPLIRTAQEVGFEKLEQKLLNYFPNLLRPLSQYPAQLLGSIEVSLEELVLVYLKYFAKSCENINNNKYSLEQSILYLMSDAESTTISRVANETIKKMNIFGKTGTTSNGLDNWYVAFDGEQLILTWFGVEAQRNQANLRLSGSSSAFQIFQNFMTYRGKRVAEMYCL